MNKITLNESPPKTPSLYVGQFWLRKETGKFYMIAVFDSKYSLINLNEGYHFNSPVCNIGNVFNLKESEFELITQPFTIEPA